MTISHRKEIRKLTFRAFGLRRSDEWSRSDEGLTLETSASESPYVGQFTLSTQLIKPNYLVILRPTQHHNFFRNLPPLFVRNRKVRDFAMVLRARKVSGAFEKGVPGLKPGPLVQEETALSTRQLCLPQDRKKTGRSIKRRHVHFKV